MLTFDARLREALTIGLPIMTDQRLPAETRTIAAMAWSAPSTGSGTRWTP